MLRVFHPAPWPAAGGEVSLSADESNHLVRVRRARVGESVELLDGAGTVGSGLLSVADPHSARVRLNAVTRVPPPPVRVLAVGLPKGGVFMEIVRQAVELGATEICPLLTERSEARYDEVKTRHKMQRWRAAALEACKQSGNPWLTLISPPLELALWLQKSAAQNPPSLCLVAALTPNAKPLAQCLGAPVPRCLRLAIGPEGDFTPAEYDLFQKSGFTPVRLPGHTLRVETACVVGLACLGN